MKIQILKIKADQKVLAQEIRNLKSKRKELKGYVPGLDSAQTKYRTYHIAYCMLRGRRMSTREGMSVKVKLLIILEKKVMSINWNCSRI